MQRISRPAWRGLVSIIPFIFIASLALPTIAQETSDDKNQPQPEPVIVDPSIQAVWDITDGQIASGAVQRAWAFGPEPIAAAYEYYPQSPTNFRKVVYYDKGRLDLINPQAPPGSIWMVSGALLTTEMITGQIQLGETEFVDREPADIPLVGDLEQPNPVTYATLAPHASVRPVDDDAQVAVADPDSPPEPDEPVRHLNQVGAPVTALLTASGEIIPDSVTDHDVTIVEYEELLGHNVASPFAGWATDLPIPALNLLGLPITEPYWIETQVDSVPTMVLIQAFERRTLTYTPSNPEGWQVESGNVGLHYRLWRGLERPERPEFARLAAEIPFGEEILKAARDNYIDPYIFVAMALNSTNGNPFGTAPNGGYGLMGAYVDANAADIDLEDPGLNAQLAASQFSREMYAAWDWNTILVNYFNAGARLAAADTVQTTAEDWARAVLETAERLEAHYPPTGPRIDPVREEGKFVGEGRAAHYAESYSVEWWEEAMRKHVSWGNAVDYWKPDPHGFYCVHPDYLIGERLKLEANGRVLECTIGDQVAIPHRIAWRAKWAVELSWPTFLALGLDRNNQVRVTYLGDRVIEPPPTPEPSPTPSPTVTPPPTEEPPKNVPDTARPGNEASPTATPAPDTPTPTAQPESTAAPTGSDQQESPSDSTPSPPPGSPTPSG